MNMVPVEEITNPRQIALITTRLDTEPGKQKDNITSTTRHTPISSELYAICINKESHSLNHIKKSKVFAINFMPYAKENEVRLCSINLGRFKDKFKVSGLTKQECKLIDCPKIKEAIAHIECEVTTEILADDYTFFIGKVVNFKKNGDTKRIFKTNEDNFTTTI